MLGAQKPTTPVRVKICGITSVQDAQLAVEAGADFIGLIFAERSPRKVSVEMAKIIAESIKTLNKANTGTNAVRLVGVFQNQSIAEIQTIAKQVRLDFIQLHGEESPDYAELLPLPVIRFAPLALGKESSPWPWKAKTPIDKSAALLLEPPKGSGMALTDWFSAYADRAAALREFSKTTPLFLAGGLHTGNIATALQHIRPFAIDVASGVESSPGVKNPAHVRDFCATIKACPSDFSGDPTLCNRLDFSDLSAAFTSPNP